MTFSEVAPYGLVTTQTCDLAEEGDTKPKSAWVQLAPVFNAESSHPVLEDQNLLNGSVRKLIRSGRDQVRLWIPNLPENGLWYADLTLEVPVERGWLANRERIVGFQSETDREKVGGRLAWLRSRPAFDDRFVRAIQQPVVHALRGLNREDKQMYERMHVQVSEIGVALNGHLEVAQAELVVLHSDADEDIQAWWLNLWTSLYENAQAEEFNLLPLRVVELTELSAAEYRNLTRLPLASISPYPDWYGSDPEAFPGPPKRV